MSDPALGYAAAVAAVAGAYLAAGMACDAVRAVTRLRLPGLPSMRPVFAAATMLVVLGRVAPAPAAVPPPAQRLGGGLPVPTAIVAATGQPPADAEYVVAAGDSLWAIAERRLQAEGRAASVDEIAGYWRAIYAANAGLVGPDPDLIHPGQVLELPEMP